MYSSLDAIEARFLELEKNLCDPATFICPPRPPVPEFLFDIKSADIKAALAEGCSSSGITTSSIIGGLTPASATIVASLVIAGVVVAFLIILVVVGCLRYHKKKKINPMNNGEPGNYLYNNDMKKRRWVSNPRVMAIHNMNGTTQLYESPMHSERGEDVENGEEPVPIEKQQNEMNQSQTFARIVVPSNDNVVIETDEAPLKPKHKKHRKKRKKKRSAAVTADSDGDTIKTETVPPRQLPPITVH